MRYILIMVFVVISSFVFAGPMDKIKTTETTLLDLINQKLTVNGKEDKERNEKVKTTLSDIIEYDTFSKNSLKGINKKTKKSHWDSITPQQQKQFSDLFKKLIEQAWMKELKKFNKEKNKTLKKGEQGTITYKDEKVKGDIGVVYTVIKTKDEITNVDFRFTKEKITDFIIDDLSVTQRYRKSFSKHINEKGFDSLINKMTEKLKEIEKESSDIK